MTPTEADMKFAAEIDNLGDYTRAKRIRQYVEAEAAPLRDLLKKADEAFKHHGGLQYTNTWLARDIEARAAPNK